AFLVAARALPLLHPTQVWTASWALGTVLYSLRLLPYIHLSWLTASLICGSIVAFAAAAPLGERLACRSRARPAATGIGDVSALAAGRASSRRARRGWLVAATGSASTVYFSTSRGFIAVALAAGLTAFALAMSDAHRRALVRLTLGMVVVTFVLFVGLGAVIG